MDTGKGRGKIASRCPSHRPAFSATSVTLKIRGGFPRRVGEVYVVLLSNLIKKVELSCFTSLVFSWRSSALLVASAGVQLCSSPPLCRAIEISILALKISQEFPRCVGEVYVVLLSH